MPKIVDHDAQRALLLDGAFEFFADCGYTALSMRSLASRLETTTGVLYHYFDTKNDIFEQALMRSTERQIKDVLTLIRPDMPINERLQTLAHWLQAHQGDLKRTLLLALDAQRQAPDAQTAISQAVKRFAEALDNHFGSQTGLWQKILGTLIASQLNGDPLTMDKLTKMLSPAELAFEVA